MNQIQPLKMTKKEKELVDQIIKLTDERDGLQMRCDALEGQNNALVKNIAHNKDAMQRVMANGKAAESFALKVVKTLVSSKAEGSFDDL